MRINTTSSTFQALNAIDIAQKELRERNEQRLEQAKVALGRKYLLHPENAMSRAKFQKIAKVTK